MRKQYLIGGIITLLLSFISALIASMTTITGISLWFTFLSFISGFAAIILITAFFVEE